MFPDLAELVAERKRLEAQRHAAGKVLRAATDALAAHEKQRDHDLRAAFAARNLTRRFPTNGSGLRERWPRHSSAATRPLVR